MASYLSYKFEDTPQFVRTFDELPLWSAPFGMLLLKHLEYKPNLSILDIGSGAGFPLMEIAGRFGSTCKCYGLDVWTNANDRAKEKIQNYGLTNVTVLEGSAAQIPLSSDSIDLVVSNLGINNFQQPDVVFAECYRVLKTGGKLALTTNIDGHWKEFYTIFEQVLVGLGMSGLQEKLAAQQAHRGSVASIAKMFTNAGFSALRHEPEAFEMKFVDGSAFLNHYFVKLGWLSSWLELLEGEDIAGIFANLESALNQYAAVKGGLTLTVPMLFMEGQKVG